MCSARICDWKSDPAEVVVAAASVLEVVAAVVVAASAVVVGSEVVVAASEVVAIVAASVVVGAASVEVAAAAVVGIAVVSTLRRLELVVSKEVVGEGMYASITDCVAPCTMTVSTTVSVT